MLNFSVIPLASCHVEDAALIHRDSFDKPWSATSIQELLEQEGGFGFMALGEKPLGFILARQLFEEAEILTLAVSKSYRRQGVADALLRALVERLEGEGARVMLEVDEGNLPALGLYWKFEFKVFGRRDNYYVSKDNQMTTAMLLELKINRKK